jgi:hypothetical protein
MADPRTRITSSLRGLSAAPPPRRTRTTSLPATPSQSTPTGTDRTHSEPVGRTTTEGPAAPLERPEPPTRRRRGRSTTPSPKKLPGRQVGNKRSLVAHLPAKVRDALDEEVSQLRTTKGIVIMRALREQHHDLSPRAARPASPTGPFPPERRVRRRQAVPHRVPTTYTLWPDECEALVHVADQLDLNLSELVTGALLHRYEHRW